MNIPRSWSALHQLATTAISGLPQGNGYSPRELIAVFEDSWGVKILCVPSADNIGKDGQTVVHEVTPSALGFIQKCVSSHGLFLILVCVDYLHRL